MTSEHPRRSSSAPPEPPHAMARRLETALGAEHFRAIADYTYDWETWVGPSGEVLWLNPAVERITGYSVAECVQLPDYPLELVHEEDRAGVRQVLGRARGGESGNHYEFRVQRKDGAVRWAAISWQPIASADGENLGYRSSVRDIDERKQLESQLHEALRQAESASRAKSEFLANVSHELRTPLQSILGYAQLLGAAELEPKLEGYVRTLLEQGELLDRLVSDLLDFSSLSAGLLPLRSEPYRPQSVVEAALRAATPLATQKGLWLRLGQMQAPERCVGDPARISQVLANLLMNAIKFTEQGGAEVSVESYAAAGAGASHDGEPAGYRVTVDDTGPGMADDETLFLPFRQAEAHAARSAGGVGLGLAISRQLCERMGGSLVSGASPSGGARFVASFPSLALGKGSAALEPFDPDEGPAPLSRSFATSHPLSILVIDDVEPAREFMHAALGAHGYHAVLAASAEEAFRFAEARFFDLVLVDIQMPGIDGWEAARGLRARLGQGPFLVALTANALANDAPLLHTVGFDAFAQKPLRFRELQALLRRAHEQAASGELPSEFDTERWHELAAVSVGPGESLLGRMQQRVRGALPEVRERLATGRAAAEASAIARALHDLHGLLALIGATRAAGSVRNAEQNVSEHGAEALDAAGWSEIDARLDAVSAELARQMGRNAQPKA
ncbi:MAG TPA: PAS domain S-box protein [Polyangiaceae bacterium]|nr:PAS domain S-box protein [Polyangiaceae bacterium]